MVVAVMLSSGGEGGGAAGFQGPTVTFFIEHNPSAIFYTHRPRGHEVQEGGEGHGGWVVGQPEFKTGLWGVGLWLIL